MFDTDQFFVHGMKKNAPFNMQVKKYFNLYYSRRKGIENVKEGKSGFYHHTNICVVRITLLASDFSEGRGKSEKKVNS